MSRYRNVNCKIWNGDKFSFLSERAKLVFLHLLTTPFGTPFGAFKMSVSCLAEEVRIPLEGYREALTELFQNGMVKHDERAMFILIPRFIKHNPPANPNVVQSWAGIFNELPSCDLKNEFYASMSDTCKGLGEPFAKRFRQYFKEPTSKGIGIQEQKQKQEQKQEQGGEKESAAASPSESFETKPEKRLFLENVFLTSEEYFKLIKKFGQEKTDYWIEQVNIARGRNIEEFDRKSTSHYYTILSWADLKKERGKSDDPPPPKRGKGPACYKDKEGRIRRVDTQELVGESPPTESVSDTSPKPEGMVRGAVLSIVNSVSM
ncbi:MAG TPA: hypothetical protein VMT62_08785 [Syntrophorhabdaceae bacterium]|nr:hypothetical protein [Syntrophorhabdaceae bacterium]